MSLSEALPQPLAWVTTRDHDEWIEIDAHNHIRPVNGFWNKLRFVAINFLLGGLLIEKIKSAFAEACHSLNHLSNEKLWNLVESESFRILKEKTKFLSALFPSKLLDRLEQIARTRLCEQTENFLKSNSVIAIQEGRSGAYLINNENSKGFAIFKASDEEPGAYNNKKGVAKSPGYEAGLKAKREVAAGLLPRPPHLHFPLTTFFSTKNLKKGHVEGSLQRFVKGKTLKQIILDEKDLPTANTHLKLLSEEIHALALFDMRMLNIDRHFSNIIVENGTNSIWAIDHDWAFPLGVPNGINFEWADLPQAEEPFSYQFKFWIMQRNCDKEWQQLLDKGINLGPIAYKQLVTATHFLQRGLSLNLTTKELAIIIKENIDISECYITYQNKPNEFFYNYAWQQLQQGIVSILKEYAKENNCSDKLKQGWLETKEKRNMLFSEIEQWGGINNWLENFL